MNVDPLAYDDAPFHVLRRYIERELGVKMPESKVPMLASRLRRRLVTLGLSSYDEYVKHLFRSEEGRRELAAFVDAVTTHKTDFWREPDHFRFLSETALPRLERELGDRRRLKVWSAGCSTGEEPYTLAMVLAEHCAGRREIDFAVLATDVSEAVVAEGRRAIYDAARIAPLPPHLSKKYFLRSKDRRKNLVRVVPMLRQRVHFHPLNFMNASYGVTDTFDTVFLRNVLIYFDDTTTEKVVRRLCENLKRGGYFFTGQSESLARVSVPLKHIGPAVYVRT